MRLKNIIFIIGFIVFTGVSSLAFITIYNIHLVKKITYTIEKHNDTIQHTVNLISLSYEYLQNPYDRISYQLEDTLKLLKSNKEVSKYIEMKIKLLDHSLKKFKLLSQEQKSNLNTIAIQRLLGKVQLYSNQIMQEIFQDVDKLNSDMKKSNQFTKNLSWLISILTIVIIISIFFLFLFGRIIRPLERIINETEKIKNDIGYQISINKNDFIDFKELISTINKTSEDLGKSQKELIFNQKSLQESEKQLKTLVSNLPGMAYRAKNDNEWSMLFLSDNCKELTGYEVDDFIQNKLITYNQIIHVNDRKHVFDTIQNALMMRQSFVLEYRIVMADGTVRWVWEHGIGIFEDNELLYLEGIVLDNDERKRDEFLLLQNEERFRGLFENSEISIWNEDFTEVIKSLEELRKDGVTDLHKHLTKNIKLAHEIAKKVKVTDVNNATLRLFNADSKEKFLSGKHKTFGNDSISVFIDELNAIWENKESFTKEALFKTLDGRTIHGIVTFKIPKNIENFKSLSVSIIDITDLKKAEKELEISNDKFEKAFNITPNIIIITNLKTSEFYDVNRTGESILRYNKEELIGKTTLDINLWADPNDREDFIETLKKKGTVENAIYSFNRRNGDKVIGNVYANIIMIDNEEYILVVANDITQEYKMKKLLQQKKDELETIIQESPSPVMIYNEDGKVILVNKTWEMLTGYNYKDIDTIEKWTYLAYGERMPVTKEFISSLYELKQKTDNGIYDIITKDGNIITWQFGSAPLGLIDGKRAVISSAMDITELKKKDEMLINQSRHAAMGEMISMIAHQWRQPLSVISMDANNMLLDIALENFNTDEAEKYANSITEQTQHLSKTIDDFRNFFKPDKVISEVNIRETVDSTLTIVKDALKNNNIELTSSFETDKDVKAYPRELMQVFINIINNSKDALKLHKREDALINIRVYEDEKYINTEICDNGGGIDADILSKVFDPYFSTKDEKTGTGLGLYMSKMIIEEHLNGIIEACNSDEGACFRVRLLKERQ